MDLDSSPRTDLQETTIRDLYEEYAAAEEAGESVQKAREIESYLHDAFETVRDELADYEIELTATPDIRYDPDHEGATYSPQRGNTGPLDVGHPKEDAVKDHTLLNVLAEEAVHVYHNQLAEEYFDNLEIGEPMSDIYNDNCTLNIGYDEALTAPIVYDIGETDEPLEDHLGRLGDHYSAADETVGEQFEEMTAFIMERLDGQDSTEAITDALSFRDEMLRTGETSF